MASEAAGSTEREHKPPPTFQVDTKDLVAAVDTNVLLDLCSCHDLVRAYDKSGAAGDAMTKFRLARARDALVLAMFFNVTKASTWSVASEPVAQMLANVNSNEGDKFEFHYTMLFSNFILPELLGGWTVSMPALPDPMMTGNRADDALVAFAREHRLPLISNEGVSHSGQKDERKRVRKQAATAGVSVYTPGEFLVGKVDERKLIADFLNSFASEVPAFACTIPNRTFAAESVPIISGYFRFVLLGEMAST